MMAGKNKKGLGRGLMSLFGDQPKDVADNVSFNKSYLSVSISDLDRNAFQPRNYFD